MYRISGTCPICGGSMHLERLRCHQCGTALEGAFELSPLFRLPPEQLHFVELLVKYRGNIQRVAKELEVSSRTGRNRMDEIATAMGYTRSDLPLPPSLERRQEILESLQAGEFPSVRQAAIAAGIVKVPTRVERMTADWRNASAEEREEYLQMIGAQK